MRSLLSATTGVSREPFGAGFEISIRERLSRSRAALRVHGNPGSGTRTLLDAPRRSPTRAAAAAFGFKRHHALRG